MSAGLLQKLKSHVIDDGGLLSDYTVRYYKWDDRDLQGSGKVALFRMVGTAGETNHEYQQPDVFLRLLSDPDDVKSTDDDMLGVLRYLRDNYETTGITAIHPTGTYDGPRYLANNRAHFEMIVRCGVEDH